MLKCEGRWAAKIEELLAPHTVDEEKPEPRILTEDEGGCAYCGAELPFSFQARRFCHDGCKVMAAKRRAMGKPEARGLGVEASDAQSIELYDTSCALGEPQGCTQLAHHIHIHPGRGPSATSRAGCG